MHSKCSSNYNACCYNVQACSSNSEEKSFAKDIISKVVRNSKDTDWREYNLIQIFQFIIVTMEALYNMQRT